MRRARSIARARGAALGFAFGFALAALLGSCEERIVSNHPMLGGLPGAETGMEVTGPPGARIGIAGVSGAGGSRRTDENGTVTLTARTPLHLMKHVYDTVFKDEPRIFVEQVLSQATKDEYFERGVDVMEAFTTLRERREDIHALFNAMPRGELTPGLFIEPLGGGAQRLCVYGRAARDLSWNGFDMVMEKGNWKLRWFVSNQR